MKNFGLQKYAVLIIPLLFLLYSAPSALDYIFYFPDEKYYTDAVLQMMEKDDYFTPYKADGSPRFLKPIATYWVLMGSYKIFGVSPFSSRLFFWLTGALLIAITFLMAKSISGNHKIAITAAFITAANPLVLLSASRSIPDILLTLFLTISAWGFLEIMISEKPLRRFYWMAYLGAALAFETKGLPAVVFAGASMLYLLLNPWKRIKFKNLFETYSLVISILVAISWFAIMYATHGANYLGSFFEDQVGGRVSSKTLQVLTNAALGILNLIAFLIPWVIIAFSNPKQQRTFISTSDNRQKSVFGFILLWVILIILMSGAVFKFYDRYVLPVIPLVAILLASLLHLSKTRFKKGIISILLALNVTALVINVLYAIFILSTTILIFAVILVFNIIAQYKFGVFRNASSDVVIANGILLLYFSLFVLLNPLLMPNPGKQLVVNLKNNGIVENSRVYVYGNIRTASNIRIQSHHKMNVISMDTVYTIPATPNHFLVFDKRDQNRLDLTNYEIEKGSEEWLRVPVSKFPDFLQKPVLKIKEGGTTYFIAKPKSYPYEKPEQ